MMYAVKKNVSMYDSHATLNNVVVVAAARREWVEASPHVKCSHKQGSHKQGAFSMHPLS